MWTRTTTSFSGKLVLKRKQDASKMWSESSPIAARRSRGSKRASSTTWRKRMTFTALGAGGARPSRSRGGEGSFVRLHLCLFWVLLRIEDRPRCRGWSLPAKSPGALWTFCFAGPCRRLVGEALEEPLEELDVAPDPLLDAFTRVASGGRLLCGSGCVSGRSAFSSFCAWRPSARSAFEASIVGPEHLDVFGTSPTSSSAHLESRRSPCPPSRPGSNCCRCAPCSWGRPWS